jgi:LacI family transcriptional regulator
VRKKDDRPTIADVARQALVSKATVSHVLNSTRFVEEATRQRVLQAIAELGYRPNSIARSLTTKRTGTIGVVISDAANHFFGELLRGVEDALADSNYGLIVCNTDEVLQREARYLDLLLRQQVEGIIAAATSQSWRVLSEAETRRTPIVFVDRTFEGMGGIFVGVDNVGGAYYGTRHLIEAGHRQIGIIAGFQRLSTMRERLTGFMQALAEHDIPLPDDWLSTCQLSVDAGREAARRILQLAHRPTALFVNNNLLMLGTLLATRELGLRCPEDIALLGFDDHPWAAASAPPLSVVAQPVRQMGRTAAELLLLQINGKKIDRPSIKLDCQLVLRQSCCPEHSK